LSDNPDRFVPIEPRHCCGYRGSLTGAAVTVSERQQVVDLPPAGTWPSEHGRAWECRSRIAGQPVVVPPAGGGDADATVEPAGVEGVSSPAPATTAVARFDTVLAFPAASTATTR